MVLAAGRNYSQPLAALWRCGGAFLFGLWHGMYHLDAHAD